MPSKAQLLLQQLPTVEKKNLVMIRSPPKTGFTMKVSFLNIKAFKTKR